MKQQAMKPTSMDISRNLTTFREKAPLMLGIPFEEILQRCGITEKHYLACEQGMRRLRADQVARLQSEFKLNSNWLFNGKGSMFLLKDGNDF